MPITALLLVSLVAAPRADDPVLESTGHYVLSSETPSRSLAELGAVLEAAWPLLDDYFGREPRLKKGDRLEVRMFDGYDSWRAAIEEDGGIPPAQDSACHFDERSDRVYLVDQADRAWTRSALLYGAVLQFHANLKAKNRGFDRTWYMRGVAENMSRHWWDGERLVVGAPQLASMRDIPSRASDLLQRPNFRIRDLRRDELVETPLAWAVVGSIVEGGDAQKFDRFSKLALGKKGSLVSGDTFARSLGRLEDLEVDITSWVHANQQPLRVAWGDWEQLGEGRLRATERQGALSLLRLKDETCERMEVTLRPSGLPGSSAGIVFDASADDALSAALVSERDLLVNRYDGSSVKRIELISLGSAPKGGHRLGVERAGEQVVITLNGERLTTLPAGAAGLGLAALGGPVEFLDVQWD